MLRILYIFLALLIFSFIVMAHEFGHYIVGRLCGIGITEFSIGFGPKILGFKRKDTLYSIRIIPLGGFCAFVGEDDDNPAPNAMNKQPVWKRFLTVAAGPGMNFILAFVFCVMLLSGFMIAEYQPRIGRIYENTPAAQSALQEDDVVVDVNGSAISYDTAGMETVRTIIDSYDGSNPLQFTVERDGEQIMIPLQPAAVIDETTGATDYQIGIEFTARTFTFPEAIRASCGYMKDFVLAMLQSLKDLVFGKVGTDELMGPVGIISFVSDAIASSQLYLIVYLVFILSLNLGIMNLLPVPALDGGRLIFLIVEGIRRKPIPPEKEGMVHAIGLALLMGLILFVTYKDIIRLVTGG